MFKVLDEFFAVLRNICLGCNGYPRVDDSRIKNLGNMVALAIDHFVSVVKPCLNRIGAVSYPLQHPGGTLPAPAGESHGICLALGELYPTVGHTDDS